jgi:hypothetical protein
MLLGLVSPMDTLMLVVLVIFPTLVPVLQVQTLMLLLAGFPLLVLPQSLPDWMRECTTLLTIILSLNMMAPLALPTIMPEWTSHCTIFHLLGVESLSIETLLLGWTNVLTIALLLAVDVLVTDTPLVALALVLGLMIIIPTNLEDPCPGS